MRTLHARGERLGSDCADEYGYGDCLITVACDLVLRSNAFDVIEMNGDFFQVVYKPVARIGAD